VVIVATPRAGRPKGFLTEVEQQAVVDAIGAAERCTSGEIRVHLEHRCKGGDALARGRRVFEQLGMTATEARNGVLVYLATGDRVFAVLGDRGIDEVVEDGFWDDVTAAMTERFREDDFAGGLVEGIGRIADKLAARFPFAGEADVDELPNEISLGEDDGGAGDEEAGPTGR
jgi:uncharacterized membrane protein YgcG